MHNEKEEWEVQHILSSHLVQGQLKYQVEQTRWDPNPAYYPASDFKNALVKLRQFHDKNPNQEGPPKQLNTWERATMEDKYNKDHPKNEFPISKKGIATTKLRRSGHIMKKG